MYRLWINSLGLDGVNVNNLYEECKDGVVLCKVVDALGDGKCIDWKKVTMEPRQVFDRNNNNGEAIHGAKNLGMKFIGIGGTDIVKGNKKLVLATVY